MIVVAMQRSIISSPLQRSPGSPSSSLPSRGTLSTDLLFRLLRTVGFHKRRTRILLFRTCCIVLSLVILLLRYYFPEKVPETPSEELALFLRKYRQTPGGVFIELLQTTLYQDMEQEALRLQACHTPNTMAQTLSNSPLCFAGADNYRQAMDHIDQTARQLSMKVPALMANTPLMEQHVYLPTNTQRSVYELRRYGASSRTEDQNWDATARNKTQVVVAEQLIPNLGTPVACLPLLLGGMAVSQVRGDQFLVAELGPYFGLSSKCIVTGLAQTQTPSFSFRAFSNKPTSIYFAYDLFRGMDNLRSLQNRSTSQWILDTYYPDINNKQNTDQNNPTYSNFQFLWERVVKPVYELSYAVPGKMEAFTSVRTIYERAILTKERNGDRNYRAALVVVDSAKTHQGFVQQISSVFGSRNSFLPGTIVFLMDFEYVSIQVKQVYGCLRDALLPVYISWNREHWAFVVTKPVSLTDQHLCYYYVAQNLQERLVKMEQQITTDLEFVSHGLRDGHTAGNHDPLKTAREQLQATMLRNLRDKMEHWQALARSRY